MDRSGARRQGGGAALLMSGRYARRRGAARDVDEFLICA